MDSRRRGEGLASFGEAGAGLKLYASLGTVVWRYWPEVALAALAAVAEATASIPGARAVLSLGHAAPGAGELRALERPGVTVAAYVDQWAILEEADVFLTHHGLSSTHEAIWHEVPMLSYPMFWDQPALSAKCQELGLARPLVDTPRGELGPDPIRAALEDLARRAETTRDGHPVVVVAGTETLRFAIDTGASRTLVSTEAAVRLGLVAREAFRVAWVGGSSRTGLCAAAPQLRVGTMSLTVDGLGWVPSLRKVTADDDVDGPLGADALVSVGLWIDASRGRARLARTGELASWVGGTRVPLERIGRVAAHARRRARGRSAAASAARPGAARRLGGRPGRRRAVAPRARGRVGGR